MPKVSVIMPSLNVAGYIRECMDSVLGQTLQDMEIICVDAGSTDGTLEMLREYERRDGRVRLIVSGRRSYGHQMNLGLDAARGEYIGIVETDDFVAPEMYGELYRLAASHGADFVKADFDVFATLGGGERVYLRYFSDRYTCARYGRNFSSGDYKAGQQTMDVFIWNGIYRRSFLEGSRIRFQETPGAAFQDCGFRYQVALAVERGLFVDRSLYRYRRDNTGSSTYNRDCVIYNLSECRAILEAARKRGLADRGAWAFLARETAVVALRPYIELLGWAEPGEGTGEALEGFRSILKEFIGHGLLRQQDVPFDMWMEIRMFVENPGAFEYYARLKAETTASGVRSFLDDISQWKHVVLFGSGYVGRCAYCLMRLNGLGNIVAFADNDQGRWGGSYGGSPIEGPGRLAGEYPDAYYLVANASAQHYGEIHRQLRGYGVPDGRIGRYGQTTFPLACMNIFTGGSR